jgi:hypothetical protein
MKTIVTVIFEVDWENKYDAHGTPDMREAMHEFLNEEVITRPLGYEWDMEEDVAYIEGEVKVLNIDASDIVTPVIKPLPFCEHCGEGHEEFGCEFEVDGTVWCLNCYLSDKNDGRGYLYSYYNDMVKKAEIKYLENKLKQLKKK